MRKNILSIVALCFILTLATRTNAANIKSGEITYQWISDSTYKFKLSVYGSYCEGFTNPLPDSTSLCYFNNCNSQSGHIVLHRDPSSGQTASKMRSYSGSLTIPSRCNYWTFYSSILQRDSTENLQNGNYNLYVEATLNNLDAQNFSAPFYTVDPPQLYLPINRPTNFNYGGVDPDNDSLTYELIQPRTAPANFLTPDSCLNSYAATTIPYGTTGLTKDYPFSCSGFSSNVYGGIFFTPTAAALGWNTLAMRINKYRNGKKLGSVMCDMSFNIESITLPTPEAKLDYASIQGATLVDSTHLKVYSNTPFSFCVDGKLNGDFNLFNYKLSFIDKHDSVLNGSVANYFAIDSSHKIVCYTWTPTAADTGKRIFNVVAAQYLTKANCHTAFASSLASLSFEIEVINPTGITELATTNAISIFPNPVQNNVHIYSPITVNASISSIDGRQLLHKDNAKDIDISSLSNGIYFIRITNAAGALLKQEKLIKQ